MKTALRPKHTGILLVSAVFAALVPPTASAQQERPWEKIPVPPLHQFKPQQPKRIQLKNGIVIFLQEDHELPFVYGSVLIPGGSRDEDAAKAGLVDLYGQTWRTSGTAKMDGDAMDDLLEAKAAHIETGGGADSTSLAWDSLKADAEPGFFPGPGLASPPQIRPAETPHLPSSRKPPGSSGAMTMRQESPTAKLPSWSMGPIALTPASPKSPPSARSPSPICRPGTTAPSRAS